MIRLLVDSASDIESSNKITVIPLSIHINNQTYLDQVDIQHDKFYKMLENTETFPKTSQPSPNAFVKVFEEIKANGEECICILLSSNVSGTYQSALLAKNIVDYEKIYLIDSLTGSYCVELLANEAQKCINEGKSVTEIIDILESLKKRTRIYLSVDTLEYLYRGGRLNKVSAMIGNITKIKPIITVTREGTIEVATKGVGLFRTMNEMIHIIQKEEIDENYNVYSIYTTYSENIEKFEKKLSANEIKLTNRKQLGPVVGSHLGPKAFGIMYISKN